MSARDIILNGLQMLLPSFAKSDASIEGKIIDVVGTYADTEIIERNNTLTTIQQALANQKVTNTNYYRDKAVKFQIGDVLQYDPVNFGGYYNPVNPENQIMKQAYVVGSYPEFTLLINPLGSDGHLRKATNDELVSFRTYFQAFQPLGLPLTINSLDVAKITDPNIIVYVRAGTDAGDAVEKINANFLAYESVLRDRNTVSLTEIVDIIQRYESVEAVGLNDPVATEQQIDGSFRTTRPINGIFELTNGAFTFATALTVEHIKVL